MEEDYAKDNVNIVLINTTEVSVNISSLSCLLF